MNRRRKCNRNTVKYTYQFKSLDAERYLRCTKNLDISLNLALNLLTHRAANLLIRFDSSALVTVPLPS